MQPLDQSRSSRSRSRSSRRGHVKPRLNPASPPPDEVAEAATPEIPAEVPRRTPNPPPEDGHVRPAPGRVAKRLRKETEKEARETRVIKEAQETAEKVLQRMRPLKRRGKTRNSQQIVTEQESRSTDRVRPRGVVWLSWRWVSGTMTAVLLIVLVIMLTTDAFYVSTVAVGGVNYLSREEVFRYAGISQKHIFWVDPLEVEAQLEANNNIADADVRVGWTVPMVQILVRERDPALIWEQGDNRVWVDINGLVMYQRIDRPDLLRIVYDPNVITEAQQVVSAATRIDPEIIQGALLLRSQMPAIDVMVYHPEKGLGWRDPRGWMAWFGIGDNMVMKATVYDALVTYNIDAVQFGEVNVADPDNPIYTILWRKSEN